MRPLATHRQSTAMPQATIAAQVHQSLNVQRHFTPQIAFHAILAINQFADAEDLLIRKLVDPTFVGDAKLLTNGGGLRRT